MILTTLRPPFDDSLYASKEIQYLWDHEKTEILSMILKNAIMDPSLFDNESYSPILHVERLTICFPQFNDLPPEIKEHIIRQRTELIPAFSMVNHDLHELSKRLYLEEVAEQYPLYHELLAYKMTYPLMLGSLVHQIHVTNTKEKRTLNVYTKERHHNYKCIRIETLFDNVFSDCTTSVITNTVTPDDIIIDAEYDYLTLYRILKKRLSCVRLQATYVKDYILRDLDEYFKDYFKDPPNGQYDNIILYLFLYLNAYIFNIYPSPIEISTLIERNKMNDISMILNVEIPRLYIAIREAIMKLD